VAEVGEEFLICFQDVRTFEDFGCLDLVVAWRMEESLSM